MDARSIEEILSHNRRRSSGSGDKYIWRTQGDKDVRSSHAARDGQIFSWDNPPPGGHPGEDFGCRCWAEPIVETFEEEDTSKSDLDVLESLEQSFEEFLENPISELSIPLASARYLLGNLLDTGPVTLGQLGLLEDVKRSSGTETARERFRKQLKEFIEKEMIITQPGNYSLEDFFEESYAFHDASTIIGNGTLRGIFRGRLIVGIDGSYRFDGDLDFNLKDAFVDPFDLGNNFERDIDLPGARPFEIFGSWKEFFFGRGVLTFLT